MIVLEFNMRIKLLKRTITSVGWTNVANIKLCDIVALVTKVPQPGIAREIRVGLVLCDLAARDLEMLWRHADVGGSQGGGGPLARTARTGALVEDGAGRPVGDTAAVAAPGQDWGGFGLHGVSC